MDGVGAGVGAGVGGSDGAGVGGSDGAGTGGGLELATVRASARSSELAPVGTGIG